MLTKDIEEILGQVTKPGRYLGNEWNVSRRNFSDAKVRIALCFPDVYEVGMSHLGFRIIYGLLNSLDDTICERVFSPWPDFSNFLLQKGLPLFSLESRVPLNKFDIVAFTLAYEMNYTNVLDILKLSKIPLKAEDRENGHPLIIGGGPCTLNPEPLADFFDLFIVGEGEDVVVEFVAAFKRLKANRLLDKSDLFLELAKIEGVYVPSFYSIRYSDSGKINKVTALKENIPSIIKKRVVHNLDNAFYPIKYLVPYIGIIHDRIVIEIMRGCVHKCRFCQANVCYKPMRIRGKEKILNLVKESAQNTGYEDVSLMSLSSGDYPGLAILIKELLDTDLLKQKGISMSLSSLRVEDVLCKLPRLIKKVKKTGLTFAPEAGTERLRKVICKMIDIEKLKAAIKVAQKEGWRRVKLYFMIGLPTENYSDIDGILYILNEIKDLTKNSSFDIGVSISSFIPKAHTPFQWTGMEGLEEFLQKQTYIRQHLNSNRIKLKFHNVQLSFIEAVFSRGDRRLSNVLLTAFRDGARFDGWNEFFNFDTWMRAFGKENLDPEFYIEEKKYNELLPWGHIDAGVTKEYLIKEAKEAFGHIDNIESI